MGKLFSSSIFHIALAFAFAATVECRNGFLSQIVEEMRQEGAPRPCPAEYADKCEYWVDEGCSSDKNGPDDMEGFYQSQDSTAFVRCCKEGKNGPKCDTISDCSNEGDLVPYGEAAELCTNKGEGWRLCTKEELLSNICCKTGGGCHSVAVWTSTWAMCDTNESNEFKCPDGYDAISQNLDGEKDDKEWISPDAWIPSGQTIESACLVSCEEREGCTGFEYGPVQSAWGDYDVGDYACATFIGGVSNIRNEAGRLNKDSKWRSCIKPQ